MPYLCEKMKIEDPCLDRRIKIPKSKYGEIVEKYEELNSLRKVADIYNVNKGTIRKIVNTDYYEQQKEGNKLRSKAYRERIKQDSSLRERRNECMRNHRKYKKELSDKGLIGGKNE